MANDPLEPMRDELSELTDLMNTIETCGRTMQAAVEMMNSAPKIMLDKMQTFYPQDGPYGPLVLRFTALQGQLAQRLDSGKAHIQAMHSIIQRMFEQSNSISQSFKQRDEAYLSSSHYDKKVENLRQSMLRSSGNQRLVEKCSRNEQKRIDSLQAFQQISDETEKSASAILSRKLQDTGEAVGHICRYLSNFFDGAERVANELNNVADGFARPSSPEEMMRRGREYAAQAASQARERMSGFASSARDRLSEAGQAANSKWQSASSGGRTPESGTREPAWGGGQQSPGGSGGWPGFGGAWPSGSAGGNGYASGGPGGSTSPWGTTPPQMSASGAPGQAGKGGGPPSPWGPPQPVPVPGGYGGGAGFGGGSGGQVGNPWGSGPPSGTQSWGSMRR